MWWHLKKTTSLFKCWLRNRNFTQNTLDTRCQIKSLMWPHKIWRFQGGGVNCTDNLPLKSPSTIYPKSSVRFTPLPESPGKIYPSNCQVWFNPPQIVQCWAKFQTHTTSCFASQRSFLRKTNNWKCTVGCSVDVDKKRNIKMRRLSICGRATYGCIALEIDKDLKICDFTSETCQ